MARRLPRVITVLAVLVTALAVLLVAGAAASVVERTTSTSAKASGSSQATTTTFSVSPSGSDANPCSSSRPCRSFRRAYEVASPGDSVLVANGTYSGQTIPYTLAKSQKATCRWAATFGDGVTTAKNISGCVTFRPAAGARPVVAGSIVIGVPYVMVDGIGTVDTPDASNAIRIGWSDSQGGSCGAYNVHDVIVRNSGANLLFINGVTYTYVIGSDFGPVNAESSYVGGCAPGDGSNFNTTHLALDGNTFHDLIQTADGQHLECIHWYDGSRSVIRKNKFLNCAQFNISLQQLFVKDSSIANLLIENNIFDAACSHQTLNTRGGLCGGQLSLAVGCVDAENSRGIVIRFNSFTERDMPQFFENIAGCFKPLRVYGNIMMGPPNGWWCDVDTAKGVIYSYNIFTSEQVCGATNSSGIASPYVDSSKYDFSLKPATTAIGFAPSTVDHPNTDIAGDKRPLRMSSDAGADQREPALIALGRSIGVVKMRKSIAPALEFYGKGRRATVRVGTKKLERVTFRVRGRSLWALVDDEVVVGVGTTSPYYTTLQGLGVGADAKVVRAWDKSLWMGCRKAYRRSVAGLAVYAGVPGGKNGKTVGSLSMLETAYDTGCKAGF